MFINQWFNRYHKDYYGGGLMIVIGLGAVACGADYQIGSLRQMGPGFFPVAVGVLLAMSDRRKSQINSWTSAGCKRACRNWL